MAGAGAPQRDESSGGRVVIAHAASDWMLLAAASGPVCRAEPGSATSTLSRTSVSGQLRRPEPQFGIHSTHGARAPRASRTDVSAAVWDGGMDPRLAVRVRRNRRPSLPPVLRSDGVAWGANKLECTLAAAGSQWYVGPNDKRVNRHETPLPDGRARTVALSGLWGAGERHRGHDRGRLPAMRAVRPPLGRECCAAAWSRRCPTTPQDRSAHVTP
jgi:hypothetical protein